jgi:orotate phosphoribosyltransferase
MKMSTKEAIRKLLELLRERSYQEGTFTLASGKQSDFYIDVRETALWPAGCFLIGGVLHDKIVEIAPTTQYVASVAVGGVPLGTAVSLVSHIDAPALPSIVVRKESKDHGTGGRLMGVKHAELGSRVVLVEDVATTGGSSLRAAEALVDAGFQVTDIIVLVDRMEGAREAIQSAGFGFHSVFTRNDFVH